MIHTGHYSNIILELAYRDLSMIHTGHYSNIILELAYRDLSMIHTGHYSNTVLRKYSNASSRYRDMYVCICLGIHGDRLRAI